MYKRQALAEENIEDYIPLPKQIIGTGHFFILKAHGDSMIGAGINEGDYVVIRCLLYTSRCV